MKLQPLRDSAIGGAMADDDIECRKSQSQSQSPPQRAVPMKILVLGLSRTGTNGMYLAHTFVYSKKLGAVTLTEQ